MDDEEPEDDVERDADGYPLPLPGYCNARNPKTMGRCGRPEGHGTDYRVGPCRAHGGRHPNGRRSAALATYAEVYSHDTLFGQALDLDPMVGLLEVGGKLAGFTAYLEREITRRADADADGRVQLVQQVTSANGAREMPDVLVGMWLDALDRQAKAHKLALDAGAQRAQLDLFAAYRDRVLDVLEAVLRDVGVDPDDPAVSEKVASRLMLVAGGLRAAP
jgi:hypothetical protein